MRRLLRSALFVPANNERAIKKAASLGADMLILDLEDAVGPADKSDARDRIESTLKAWSASGSICAIRINSLQSEWGACDLRAATRADAIILPKVEQVGDLHNARTALSSHGSSIPIWAMIETPRGVINVASIASATGTGLDGILAGVNDLSKELHCSIGHERIAIQSHLAAIVCAGRANNLYVLDGVYNAFRDMAGFIRESHQGRIFGFDGKSLIHPTQIEAAHNCFAPSPSEIEHAALIIAAFADPANACKGVIQIEGEMVERLHLDAARILLAAAGGNDA